MSLSYFLLNIISPFISSWIIDIAIKKMQSEHESLNNNSLQSKYESEVDPYLNCNPPSTPLQSKHESKLTQKQNMKTKHESKLTQLQS